MNLIKYIVIPIEGILISWVRNKLFSLLFQMKTSLFCRESMSLADWLAPVESSLASPAPPPPAAAYRPVPRVEFWGWGR